LDAAADELAFEVALAREANEPHEPRECVRQALVVRAVLRQPHRLLKRLSVPPRHPPRRRRGARAFAPTRHAVGARAATETRALG